VAITTTTTPTTHLNLSTFIVLSRTDYHKIARPAKISAGCVQDERPRPVLGLKVRCRKSVNRKKKPFQNSEVNMTQILAKNRMGRVILHSICAVHDHHWAWHWQGILREIHHNVIRATA
jgi:hypothetical protein